MKSSFANDSIIISASVLQFIYKGIYRRKFNSSLYELYYHQIEMYLKLIHMSRYQNAQWLLLLCRSARATYAFKIASVLSLNISQEHSNEDTRENNIWITNYGVMIWTRFRIIKQLTGAFPSNKTKMWRFKFSFSLDWKQHCANSQVPGDLRHYDAHLTSPYCSWISVKDSLCNCDV